MDEDILRQLLAAQSGVESSPTAEMMMMNSSTMNGMDSIDPELIHALQQQQQQQTVHVNPSVVRTTRTTASTHNDDDDLLLEDETFLERVVALKEMFPEPVQNAVSAINHAVVNTSKLAFSKGRIAAWWVTSTMCVLVFPILIQKELLQVAEQISREQRSILLGPQAAGGAFSGGAF